MLVAIAITFFILLAFAIALPSARSDRLIAHRRYNNRYNDAAGAREDHLG
jgi:hypothetical protein